MKKIIVLLVVAVLVLGVGCKKEKKIEDEPVKSYASEEEYYQSEEYLGTDRELPITISVEQTEELTSESKINLTVDCENIDFEAKPVLILVPSGDYFTLSDTNDKAVYSYYPSQQRETLEIDFSKLPLFDGKWELIMFAGSDGNSSAAGQSETFYVSSPEQRTEKGYWQKLFPNEKIISFSIEYAGMTEKCFGKLSGNGTLTLNEWASSVCNWQGWHKSDDEKLVNEDEKYVIPGETELTDGMTVTAEER